MEEFLAGLKRQTYQNFRLVVTNYKEKKVKKALIKSGLPFEFYQSKRDCVFSFTEVIANTFSHLKKGKHILVWTNADNVFEENFFEEIVNSFEPGIGGTSLPHMTYASYEDYLSGVKRDFSEEGRNNMVSSFWDYDPNYWVPDTVFVDGDVFVDKANQKLFLKYDYQNRHLGVVQSLGLGFFAKKKINLIFKSKIGVIQNSRSEDAVVKKQKPKKKLSEEKATKVFYDFYKKEALESMVRIEKYCDEKGISRVYRFANPWHKLCQTWSYRPVGTLEQKVIYEIYITWWALVSIWRFYPQRLFRWIKRVFRVRVLGVKI